MIGRLIRLLALVFAMLCTPALRAADQRFQFPQQYSMTPKGVNLQTGRFTYSKVDLSIGDLELRRTWGEMPSFTARSHAFGPLQVFAQSPYLGFTPSNAGWTHNFAQGVFYCPGCGNTPTVVVVAGGKAYRFKMASNQPDVFLPAGQDTTGTSLAYISGQWSFIDRSGAEYVFAGHPSTAQPNPIGNRIQLLQSVTFADGSRNDYSYTSTGGVRFVRSNRSYAIGFEYSGDDILNACAFNLAQAYADETTPCSASDRVVSYSYSAGNLATVTDLSNAVTTMSYIASGPGAGLVTCISLPNSAMCEIQNVYGPQPGDTLEVYDDQVRQQTTAAGQVWTYSYVPQADPADLQAGPQTPVFSSGSFSNGATSVYVKFDRGRIIQQNVAGTNTGFRYVTYSSGASNQQSLLYFDDASPGLVIHPEGNNEFFQRDSRGNVLLHSTWPKGYPNPASTGSFTLDQCCIAAGNPTPPPGSISASQTFLPDAGFLTQAGTIRVVGCGAGIADAKLCDKPTSVTDANGNTTTYTYDPAHGGVLTETGPAVNGVQPQTRYAYEQRYARLALSGGGTAQATTSVWLLVQKSLCRTGAASGGGCALGASDEVRTLYDYGPATGPSNLLLRGMVEDATGAALRACYTYDRYGNRIGTTLPRGTGGLTSCP